MAASGRLTDVDHLAMRAVTCPIFFTVPKYTGKITARPLSPASATNTVSSRLAKFSGYAFTGIKSSFGNRPNTFRTNMIGYASMVSTSMAKHSKYNFIFFSLESLESDGGSWINR
jgi:hypothetical protein